MFSKNEGIEDLPLLSRNRLGKFMNSIHLLMDGILMKCLMWLISESVEGRKQAYANKKNCNIGRRLGIVGRKITG